MTASDLRFFSTYCTLVQHQSLSQDPAFREFERVLQCDGAKETVSSSDEVSRELIQGLNGAFEQAMAISDRDVVALVGNTGVGKSTAINHLVGCKMQFVKGGCVDVSPDSKIPSVARIGHLGSETIGACMYSAHDRTFLDTEGFLGTRGDVSEVVAPLSLKWTLQNARSVKLVLCVDLTTMFVERGGLFLQLLKTVFGKFVDHKYSKLSFAFMLLVTKVRRIIPTGKSDSDGNEIYEMPTLEWVREEIGNCCKNAPADQARIFNFILSEEVKIYLHQPLEDNQRLLQELDRMKTVKNPRECFSSIPYSTRTIDYLANRLRAAIEKITSQQYKISLRVLKRREEGILTAYSKESDKRKGEQGGFWVHIRRNDEWVCDKAPDNSKWHLNYSGCGTFQLRVIDKRKSEGVLCLLDETVDKKGDHAHWVHARKRDEYCVENSQCTFEPTVDGRFYIRLRGANLTVQDMVVDTRNVVSKWVTAQKTDHTEMTKQPDHYQWSIVTV